MRRLKCCGGGEGGGALTQVPIWVIQLTSRKHPPSLIPMLYHVRNTAMNPGSNCHVLPRSCLVSAERMCVCYLYRVQNSRQVGMCYPSHWPTLWGVPFAGFHVSLLSIALHHVKPVDALKSYGLSYPSTETYTSLCCHCDSINSTTSCWAFATKNAAGPSATYMDVYMGTCYNTLLLIPD